MAALNVLPNKWGPALTQKDYHFMMEGATRVSAPVSLLEHGVTSPSQELTDPVTVTEQSIVNGKIKTVTRIVLPAEQTGLTYTLLFPSSLWTPALQKARESGTQCETDFYGVYLCPTDPRFSHARIYPRWRMDPPVDVNDFITSTTETEILNEQTTLRGEGYQIAWALDKQLLVSGLEPLHAVSFMTQDCVGCQSGVFTDIIAAGESEDVQEGETPPPSIFVTDDRFATQDTPTSAAAAGSTIQKTFTFGDTILNAYSDGGAIGSASAGGVEVSFDRGQTWVDGDITVPMYGVAKIGTVYIAVGGAGGSDGVVYYSLNGLEWTAVTSAVLVSQGNVLLDIDVDVNNSRFYAVGENGTLIEGTVSNSGIVLNDLSSNLPGAPGQLNAVKVLEDGMIIVGGASGYVAQSFDSGDNFELVPFPSTSGVESIAGVPFRTVIAAGTDAYVRDILTNYEFKALGLDTSDDVTAVAMGQGNFNYFVAATDGGDVFILKPHYPNS